jgi:circadian clock protein KaiC
MSGRISSGHPGLDAVLGGGLPEHAINLLMGLPGSGKTTLAQQYVFANASTDRPAFYLSTVSEPFEKMVRYGQTLSFFDPHAVGRSIFYEDLGRPLATRGLSALPERISALLQQWRPGVIVIDSFKALRAFVADGEGFRRFLYELAGRLSAYPVTSLWVGEYSEQDMSDAPELAVADAIISLSADRSADRDIRLLQVLKLRGSDLLPGKHFYRLSQHGMSVFPRLTGPPADSAPNAFVACRSSGVAALDVLLGNQYRLATTTVLTGQSGTGKTVFGVQFVVSGAASGEGGVIATFQENSAQLERLLNGFGWSIHTPGVDVLYRSPAHVHLDEWAYELFELLERTQAKRLFVDGVGDLKFASTNDAAFREYVYSLTQRLVLQGVGVMMASEAVDPFVSTLLGESALSHVCDHLIALQQWPSPSGTRRIATVLKARSIDSDTQRMHFSIGPQGVLVQQPPTRG